MMVRGIGVEGALGSEVVASLAELAEERRYGNFWFNVRSPEVDHVGMLLLAERRTRAIEVGAGVFPLDEYPAQELGRNLLARGVSSPRLIIGIGAGQVREGALRLVEDGVAQVRAAVPAARIAIGAIGRHMLRLSGRIADAVLLNWLTPDRLMWARDQIAFGAGSGRPLPAVYLYHRAARGGAAAARIREEMAQYRQFPHHRRHQAAMGSPELIGIAAGDPRDVDSQLQPYAGFCIPVLRPLPADRSDMSEWQSLIRFFAPAD
jgi:hypothetical protein